MDKNRERGASTAEYSVGTLGSVLIAYWLYRLGAAGGGPIVKLVHKLYEHVRDGGGIFSGDWAWRWML